MQEMVASNKNSNSSWIYFISGENVFILFEKCLPYCSADYTLINGSYSSYRMKISDGYLHDYHLLSIYH